MVAYHARRRMLYGCSADAQERGVENAAGLIGLLALVAELRVEIVPPPKLVAVLPARCEGRNRRAVHEARDALGVGLVGGSGRDILELLAVGHLELHQPRPPLGERNDTSAVAVLVVVLPGLPRGLVGHLHRGCVGEPGLGGVPLGGCPRGVLRLPLLTSLLVLGLDASVVLLLLVGEDGVRVGSDVLLDVAGERTRPVAVDEVGVRACHHADVHAVELEHDGPVLVGGQSNGFGDGAGDVRTRHDLEDAVAFFPKVLHDNAFPSSLGRMPLSGCLVVSLQVRHKMRLLGLISP